MKTCTLCKEEKPKEEFYKCKATKDGFAYQCKICAKLSAVVYNKKDKFVAGKMKWARGNK